MHRKMWITRPAHFKSIWFSSLYRLPPIRIDDVDNLSLLGHRVSLSTKWMTTESGTPRIWLITQQVYWVNKNPRFRQSRPLRVRIEGQQKRDLPKKQGIPKVSVPKCCLPEVWVTFEQVFVVSMHWGVHYTPSELLTRSVRLCLGFYGKSYSMR